MEIPLVSVICSTYNSHATLNLALRSVLNQGFKDFEALVIGDGCTDKSQEVVGALNDARLTHSWPLKKIQRDTEQQSDNQRCLLDQRLEIELALLMDRPGSHQVDR